MGGSYTEFHVDFGGTSVWYHVQKGEKYFFLIEPSDNNFRIFEEWLNAYRAGTITGFFGDVVQQCAVVKMTPGQTLILPAGWIRMFLIPCSQPVFRFCLYSARFACFWGQFSPRIFDLNATKST
jgi:F-box/leucine-rich repeat protein 10/11